MEYVKENIKFLQTISMIHSDLKPINDREYEKLANIPFNLQKLLTPTRITSNEVLVYGLNKAIKCLSGDETCIIGYMLLMRLYGLELKIKGIFEDCFFNINDNKAMQLDLVKYSFQAAYKRSLDKSKTIFICNNTEKAYLTPINRLHSCKVRRYDYGILEEYKEFTGTDFMLVLTRNRALIIDSGSYIKHTLLEQYDYSIQEDIDKNLILRCRLNE